jgi:hypothetical protein
VKVEVFLEKLSPTKRRLEVSQALRNSFARAVSAIALEKRDGDKVARIGKTINSTKVTLEVPCGVLHRTQYYYSLGISH